MNEQIAKYIGIIFSRIWILLILAVASAGVVYLNGDRLFEKMYEAKMRIIITLSDTEASDISVFDSIRSSQMAVGDISQIIGSDAVLSGVEAECKVAREKLANALKIEVIPNTRIMDIGIKTNTPEGAQKIIESLDRNLGAKLKVIDDSITYKILSRPRADSTPVNQSYPALFTIAAALGGLLTGALINLIIGEKNRMTEGLDHVRSLFEEDNILLVPASNMAGQEGRNQ